MFITRKINAYNMTILEDSIQANDMFDMLLRIGAQGTENYTTTQFRLVKGLRYSIKHGFHGKAFLRVQVRTKPNLYQADILQAQRMQQLLRGARELRDGLQEGVTEIEDRPVGGFLLDVCGCWRSKPGDVGRGTLRWEAGQEMNCGDMEPSRWRWIWAFGSLLAMERTACSRMGVEAEVCESHLHRMCRYRNGKRAMTQLRYERYTPIGWLDTRDMACDTRVMRYDWHDAFAYTQSAFSTRNCTPFVITALSHPTTEIEAPTEAQTEAQTED